MADYKKLSDDELNIIAAGFDWKKYGKCILTNGGGSIPALAELTAAIVSCNWPLVAVLSNTSAIKSNPVVIKCTSSN